MDQRRVRDVRGHTATGISMQKNRDDCTGGDIVALEVTESFPSNESASSRRHPPVGVVRSETTLPLCQSLCLAALYILSSMFYFLAIRYTKSLGQYNNAMVVFCIEVLKLTVSVLMKYHEDGEFLPYAVLFGEQRRHIWRSGLPYAVPSFLYAVYNNLTFFNLGLFDPGTYQLFMQTRILFTGVLFTLLLHQPLTVRKWCALFVLTLGVASKYYSPSTIELNSNVLFMLFQALLSALAGVYNEYALKKDMHLSIHQQNFFMYLYAIGFNAVFGFLSNPAAVHRFIFVDMLGRKGSDAEVGAIGAIASTSAPAPLSGHLLQVICLIILFGATTGLCAAFILKFINSIVKAFASAIEVLLTAVMAFLLLGEKLTDGDVLAAVIVMISVCTYYTSGCGDGKLVSFR